jgi:hypothetical protein
MDQQDNRKVEMPDKMQVCISNCTACYRICTETLSHCLEMGGAHVEQQHIRTLMDCAAICRLSLDLMLRHSPYHSQVCGVCADVCTACAESCHAIGGNESVDGNADAIMLSCAEVCTKCAESCREIADMRDGMHTGKVNAMAPVNSA